MDNPPHPPRLVLGPDPVEGFPVILSESNAAAFTGKIERLLAATTVREYYEEWEPEAIDDLEPERLDTAIDQQLLPASDENGRLDARLWMVQDLEDGLWEVLDGVVTFHDSMGSYPFAEIKNEDVGEIRARLTAAGYQVIGWDEVR